MTRSYLLALLAIPMILRAETCGYTRLRDSVIERNPTVLQAANWLQKMELQWKQRNAGRWPEVEIGYDASAGHARTTGDTLEQNASLRLSQELFRFGKEETSDYVLRTQLLEARMRYENTKREQIFALRRSIIDLLLVRDEIRLRRLLTSEFEQRYIRIEGRLEEGSVLPIDAKEAKLEYLDEKVRVKKLQRQERQYTMDIIDMAGLAHDYIPEDIEITINIDNFNVLNEDLVGLPEALETGVRHRLALSVTPELIKLQKHRLHCTYLQWLPELGNRGVCAYYQTNGGSIDMALQNPNDAFWRGVVSYDTPILRDGSGTTARSIGDWGVQLSVTLPLFDGFEKLNDLKKEKLALSDLQHELAAETQYLRQQIAAAYFSLKDYLDMVEIEKERVNVSKERMLIVEELIELPLESRITYDDVLRRRQDFTQAQQRYFDVRRGYLLASEQFRQATGVQP